MDIEQYLINTFLEKKPDFSCADEKPGDDFTADAESDLCLQSLACFYMLRNAEAKLSQAEQRTSAAEERLEQERLKSEELHSRLVHYRAEYNDLRKLPFDHKISQKLDDRYKKIKQAEEEIENIDFASLEKEIEETGRDTDTCRRDMAGICVYTTGIADDPAVREYFNKMLPAGAHGQPPLEKLPFDSGVLENIYTALRSEKIRRGRAEKEEQRKAEQEKAVAAVRRKKMRRKKIETFLRRFTYIGKEVLKWGFRALLVCVIFGGGVFLLYRYGRKQESAKNIQDEADTAGTDTGGSGGVRNAFPFTPVRSKKKYSLSEMDKSRIIEHHAGRIPGRVVEIGYRPKTKHVIAYVGKQRVPVGYGISFVPEGKPEKADVALWVQNRNGTDDVFYCSINPDTGETRKLAHHKLLRVFTPADIEWPLGIGEEKYRPPEENRLNSDGNIRLLNVTSKPYRDLIIEAFKKPGVSFDNSPDAFHMNIYFDISLKQKDYRILKVIANNEIHPE